MIRAGVLAAVAVWTLAAAAGGQEPPPPAPPAAPRVTAVEFTGLRWAKPDDLLGHMKTRPGRPYDRAVLDDDIRRLGMAGFLVVAEPEFAAGRLRLQIDERPTIRAVEVHGPKEITEAEVRTAAGLRVGDPVMADVQLDRARESIRALYRDRGWQFTHVTVAASDAPRGVRVQVVVDEGPRTEVLAVEITGAHGVTRDDLLGLMETQASTWVGAKYLETGKLAADVARCERHYRERGWLDARVTLGTLQHAPDGTGVTVRLHVEEGRRWRVRDVRIEGAKAVPVAELYDLLAQPLDVPHDAREVFGDPPQRPGDLQRLRTHYEARGYFHVEILPVVSVSDPAKAELDIVYRINEREPTRIGRVDIVGNRVTRERVVRRHLPFAPGELLQSEQLQLGLLRLYQTQYFRDVRVDDRPGQTAGTTDLLIELEESDRSGNLQFGGAFNQSLGLQGTFQLEIQNFDAAAWSWPWNIFRAPHWRGGGQSLRMGVSAGGKYSNYSITFQEPRLFDTDFTLGLSGNIYSRSYLDYDERRRGGSVDVGRTLARWMGVGLSWTGQLVEVRNVDLFAAPELQGFEALGQRPISKWRARVNFDWVERDAGRRAYQGFEVDLSAELAHKAFGSHWNFWTAGIHPQLHWTLFGHESQWRHVISLRLAFEYAEAIGKDPDVPIFERFYAGGFGTIRGFDYRDVGPRVNNRPVGGDILATGSLEYSIPLYRDTLGGSQHVDVIRMVFFYDWGTLLPDWDSYQTQSWRMSWGFGFRLNPLGFPVPFALDFGWVLKREPEDDTELISVTFDVRF